MRYDGEHKQRTRDRVLKEAAKAIRANGPHRVGVAEVMARAGLTHGGFYAHFDSKDALIAAAIDTMFASAGERWQRETADRAPAEALDAYVDFYLSMAHRDARGGGCPIAALAADLPRLTPTCRASFAAGVDRLSSRIAEKLEALGREDAQATGRSVVAELVGALSFARIEPEREAAEAMLAQSRRMVKRRLGLVA
jgi:TetR/AcrR family transcriptional regulator, transcriptional repressor for nem operon